MRKPFLLLATIMIVFFSTGFFLVSKVSAVGNDFVITDLRIDLQAVYNSKDYKTSIFIGGQPNNLIAGDFTTAWIGIDLAQFNGSVYSAQFSQVGLMSTNSGLHWFVYAESPVTCLEGAPIYGNLGCIGSTNSYVNVGSWHNFELVKYTNETSWIARVWDYYGNPHDVARINYNSNRIYRAQVTTEEGYSGQVDPKYLAPYWHSHPLYNTWSVGFADWPATSGGNNNIFHTYPTSPSICPDPYSGRLNWNNDPRFWFAGKTGPTPATCSQNPIF
jgi:hypothetical protein